MEDEEDEADVGDGEDPAFCCGFEENGPDGSIVRFYVDKG